MKNFYKIGQKVRVLSENTEFQHLFGLTDKMIKEFGGKTVTIDFVSSYTLFNGSTRLPTNFELPCDNYLYGIAEDNHRYLWSNTMFTVK